MGSENNTGMIQLKMVINDTEGKVTTSLLDYLPVEGFQPEGHLKQELLDEFNDFVTDKLRSKYRAMEEILNNLYSKEMLGNENTVSVLIQLVKVQGKSNVILQEEEYVLGNLEEESNESSK